MEKTALKENIHPTVGEQNREIIHGPEAEEPIAQTPEREHQELIQKTTQHLSDAGHPGVSVIPQTTDTPLVETDDLKDVGAEVIGTAKEFVVHNFRRATAGAPPVSFTENRTGLGAFIKRGSEMAKRLGGRFAIRNKAKV